MDSPLTAPAALAAIGAPELLILLVILALPLLLVGIIVLATRRRT